MTGQVVLAGAGLIKRYGQATALAGVELTVGAGESVAVMGPSGSGKSTLLHVLAGVARPDGGSVLLGGERIDRWGENRLSRLRRERFGFVFQSGQLLPELPAEENVALPLMLAGVRRRDAVAQARPWFPRLGIEGLERRRPGQLSGGQAQRVAIARALVVEPDVVFADEPTGALDQAAGDEVIRLLTGAARAHRAALVVVTHDAGIAGRCDRIVQMRDGLIVDGPRPAAIGAPIGAA